MRAASPSCDNREDRRALSARRCPCPGPSPTGGVHAAHVTRPDHAATSPYLPPAPFRRRRALLRRRHPPADTLWPTDTGHHGLWRPAPGILAAEWIRPSE